MPEGLRLLRRRTTSGGRSAGAAEARRRERRQQKHPRRTICNASEALQGDSGVLHDRVGVALRVRAFRRARKRIARNIKRAEQQTMTMNVMMTPIDDACTWKVADIYKGATSKGNRSAALSQEDGSPLHATLSDVPLQVPFVPSVFDAKRRRDQS